MSTKDQPVIKIESLADERLVYAIITPDIPKRLKQRLYDAIEAYGEQRSI